MAITIKDLADHLGLSVSTVSKALNDYGDISERTKQQVHAAAKALGYFPDAAARNLRRKETRRIGVVYCLSRTETQQKSEFYFAELRGAANAAEIADYNLVLYTLASAAQPDRLLRICQSKEVDGIILMAGGVDLTGQINMLTQQEMPFVVVSQRVEDPQVSFVAADNAGGGRLATLHLLDAGHRRIAYIGRVSLDPENSDRLAGYQQALTERGIAFDERLLRHTSDDPAGIREAISSLLAMPEPPTAIFAFNDNRAVSVLKILQERGLRVPDDVAVMGFDGLSFSSTSTPPLSTIFQPVTELGKLATQALLEHFSQEAQMPVRKILPVELIVRSSTRPIG